jgi:hypothetical protein
LFQFKRSKHFQQRSRFTKCETSFNKVKLPKVGSNAIVPSPINLDVKNCFDYFEALMSNENYDCSYLMVKIMLMVGTLSFPFVMLESKLMCEITKH